MMTLNSYSKIFDADIAVLPDVIDFVQDAMEKEECPMKTVAAVSVCIEEIFVNVCHYAYPEGTGKAQVDVCIDKEKMSVRISDNGMPFNPLEKEDPDITLDAESRSIGGLGIYMTRKMMDKVDYSYTDEKNIFTMIKNFK